MRIRQAEQYQIAKYGVAECIVDARCRRVLDVEVLVVSDPELIQGSQNQTRLKRR
jgi:hypothetical protein